MNPNAYTQIHCMHLYMKPGHFRLFKSSIAAHSIYIPQNVLFMLYIRSVSTEVCVCFCGLQLVPKQVRAIKAHTLRDDPSYLSFKTGDLIYVIERYYIM